MSDEQTTEAQKYARLRAELAEPDETLPSGAPGVLIEGLAPKAKANGGPEGEPKLVFKAGELPARQTWRGTYNSAPIYSALSADEIDDSCLFCRHKDGYLAKRPTWVEDNT